MFICAIIEGDRLVVERPSARLVEVDEPIENETSDGVGFVRDVTLIEATAVRTVASSGINIDTDEPVESTRKFFDAVSWIWLVVPDGEVVW